MDQLVKARAITKACSVSGVAVYAPVTECRRWPTVGGTCEVFLTADVFYMLLEIKRFVKVLPVQK